LRELTSGRLDPCLLHAVHIEVARDWPTHTLRCGTVLHISNRPLSSNYTLDSPLPAISPAALVHASDCICLRGEGEGGCCLAESGTIQQCLASFPSQTTTRRRAPKPVAALILLCQDYFIASWRALNAWTSSHVLSPLTRATSLRLSWHA
jgi:hypothetical protein